MLSMEIRSVKLEDTEQILNIYSYYVEKTVITFETKVPSLEDFKKRIENISKDYPYIVVENDGEILGYAYASSFHARDAYQWTAELSIYLKNDVVAKGLGTKLYDVLEQKVKNKGIKTLTACITYPGLGSIEFHKKRGYKKVAHFEKVGYKKDTWHDVVWYQKSIGDYEYNPKKIN